MARKLFSKRLSLIKKFADHFATYVPVVLVAIGINDSLDKAPSEGNLGINEPTASKTRLQQVQRQANVQASVNIAGN